MNSDDCEHDASRAPSRLRDTAFWLLGRASRTAQQLTQTRLADVGMRYGFYGVLLTLDEFGPSTQADLGRRLRVDPSDMVAILNDLESEGYVSRDRDPDDRRRNIVVLSRAGRGALTRFDRAIVEVQDDMFASFSPTEQKKFLALLQRFVAASGQPPSAP